MNNVWHYRFSCLKYYMVNSDQFERAADISKILAEHRGSYTECLNLWRGVWYDYTFYYYNEFKFPSRNKFYYYLSDSDKNKLGMDINDFFKQLDRMSNMVNMNVTEFLKDRYISNYNESCDCHTALDYLRDYDKWFPWYPLPGYNKPMKLPKNKVEPIIFDLKPRYIDYPHPPVTYETVFPLRFAQYSDLSTLDKAKFYYHYKNLSKHRGRYQYDYDLGPYREY